MRTELILLPQQNIMRISASFDAGSIEVVSLARMEDIQLRFRADSHADFRQWFYFRLQGAKESACRLRLLNAGQCTYPGGWKDYQAVASYDRVSWFRVPTQFDGSELVISHTPKAASVYYAYFQPYSWERHLDLLARVERFPSVAVTNLGSTVQGRDLDLITVGQPIEGKLALWIIARQHPGETMAEWFCEGMLDRLLDSSDPTSRLLLQDAVVYMVPNMNPDGSVLGNLRTNAAGANLNREWMNPSMDNSPEVFLVREHMQRRGVDFFLDVHGDEVLPYVFVDGCELIEGFTEAQARREQMFNTEFMRASPDFQIEEGYKRGTEPGELKANLTLASKYMGSTFGCLSLTLEMPFKDNANLPDASAGWSADRSKRLGAAVVQAMLAVLPNLR